MSVADFVVGRSARRGAHDESARIAAACFANQSPQPRTIFRAGNFPRHADVIDRRHVNQEPSRQRHVARDARALFAQRLLGDLDHHFLSGLQHFRNQLWPSRCAGVCPPCPRSCRGPPGPLRRRSNRGPGRPPPPLRSGRPPLLPGRLSWRGPRSSRRPPRLSRPRSRPPLRKGRWKRARGFPPMRAESRGNSSRGAAAPPALRGARVSPGRRIMSSSAFGVTAAAETISSTDTSPACACSVGSCPCVPSACAPRPAHGPAHRHGARRVLHADPAPHDAPRSHAPHPLPPRPDSPPGLLPLPRFLPRSIAKLPWSALFRLGFVSLRLALRFFLGFFRLGFFRLFLFKFAPPERASTCASSCTSSCFASMIPEAKAAIYPRSSPDPVERQPQTRQYLP